MSTEQTEETPKRINFYFGKKNETPVVYDIVNDELPRGKTGKVYLVRKAVENGTKNENPLLALKVNLKEDDTQSENEADFISIYEGLQKTPLKHFVKVESMGKIAYPPGAEKRKDTEKAAAVMEYGGSDLYEVHQCLKNIGESATPEFKRAVEAFHYKVLLTISEALADTEDKGLPHGDLMPANILCGFDIKEYDATKPEGLAELEKKLINCQIFLCDRDSKPDYDKSVRYSSLARRGAARLLNTFNPLGEDVTEVDAKDKDLYAFLAAYSWLTLGVKHRSSEVFAKGKLNIEIYSFTEQKYTFPDNLRNLISGHLTAELSNGRYFIPESRTTLEGSVFPVVYRPLDRFGQWEKKVATISTAQELTSLVETDDFSHQKLCSREEVSSTEQSRINALLGEFLHTIVTNLDATIKEKSKKSEPLITRKNGLEEKIQKRESEISELDKGIAAAKTAKDNAMVEYNKDPDSNDNYLEKASSAAKQSSALKKNKASKSNELTTENAQLQQVKTDLASSECNSTADKAALTYIRDHCTNKIKDTSAVEGINKILKKWLD